LHLADRASEALETLREAEALAEAHEERWWGAELHRLRGVSLTAIGADGTKIEASFCEAISTAKQQKFISVSIRTLLIGRLLFQGPRRRFGKVERFSPILSMLPAAKESQRFPQSTCIVH
jgi:predicted ATPase